MFFESNHPDNVQILSKKEQNSYKEQVYILRVHASDFAGHVRGFPSRDIVIQGSNDLDDLAEAILDAFGFMNDHLYGFYNNIKNYSRATEAYELCTQENGQTNCTDAIVVGQVFDTLKKKMLFLFDFGDMWHFVIKVIDIRPRKTEEQHLPFISNVIGEAPLQYDDYLDTDEDMLPIRGIELSDKILEINVVLQEIKPPIYRTILVPDFYTFHQLHHVIQIAFGWNNSHLYAFHDNGDTIEGFEDEFEDEPFIDAQTLLLSERQFEVDHTLKYIYDFGDNWEHSMSLQRILVPDPKQHYPLCSDGKRSAPPEDVGGVHGYGNFIDAICDPEHPEYYEYLEWVGEDFDTETVDLKEVNETLQDYAAGALELEWE